jgi:hypothetical protein
MSNILKQFVQAADHRNAGNSQAAFRFDVVGNVVFLVLRLVTVFGFFVSQIQTIASLVVTLPHVLFIGFKVGVNLRRLFDWIRLQRVIATKLAPPTPEELAERSVCIVCRAEMDTNSARKLPCGHCLHMDCLERWLGQQSRCPVCESDLSRLIADQQVTVPEHAPEPEPQPVPEAEARPVDADEVDPREKLRERARELVAGFAEVMVEIEKLQADVDALQVQ